MILCWILSARWWRLLQWFQLQNCLCDCTFNVQRYSLLSITLALSLVLCNSALKFLGNLQEIILVSTILQAAGDCGLEPVAYEFFTQAFVLYEEEVSVSQEADPSHCDQCAPAVKTWHSMLIGYCCVGIAGFQSSSDCPTTHHRHIAKNTSIWSWEQRYTYTQSNRGKLRILYWSAWSWCLIPVYLSS
jgi:hypothetical protein